MAKKFITDNEQVKLIPSQLREGMYVARLDRSWLASPFLFQGFTITSQREIATLKALCKHVYVDMNKTRPEFLDSALSQKEERVQWTDSVHLEDEITETQARVASLAEKSSGVFHLCRKSAKAHIGGLKPAVKACADSLLRSAAASLWLGHMQKHDSQLVAHAVRVALLCMVVGRHMGLPRHQLETLGLCGLLHDVGKTVGESATAEELQKRHPEFGRDLLSHDPLLPRLVLEAAYSHHERVDGKGYPEGLLADSLSYQTRIVSIADMYDKLCHEGRVTPARALQMIYLERGRRFDQEFVVQFNQAIGLYPPGSLVELNTGEVGIVLDAEPGARLRPRIALLRDSKKLAVPPSIIDLKSVHEEKADISIAKVLEDGAFGVTREAFLALNSQAFV